MSCSFLIFAKLNLYTNGEKYYLNDNKILIRKKWNHFFWSNPKLQFDQLILVYAYGTTHDKFGVMFFFFCWLVVFSHFPGSFGMIIFNLMLSSLNVKCRWEFVQKIACLSEWSSWLFKLWCSILGGFTKSNATSVLIEI